MLAVAIRCCYEEMKNCGVVIVVQVSLVLLEPRGSLETPDLADLQVLLGRRDLVVAVGYRVNLVILVGQVP